MKTKKPKSSNSKVTAVTEPKKPRKPKLAPPEKRVKSMVCMPPHKLSGPGYILISSKGSTRFERFKNLVLFVFRYVWHGRAQL